VYSRWRQTTPLFLLAFSAALSLHARSVGEVNESLIAEDSYESLFPVISSLGKELKATSTFEKPSVITIAPKTGEAPPSPSEVTAQVGIEENLPAGNANALAKTLSPLREVGKLPLPIAKTNPSGQTSYIQNGWSTDPEQFSDLTGPSGRSSFGANNSDGTFDSLRSDARAFASKGSEVPGPKSEAQKEREREEERERLEKMKEGLKNVILGLKPFEDNDYEAYEEARDLFFKENDEERPLQELEAQTEEFPQFVEKISDIFLENAPRDNDPSGRNGKRTFEYFVKDRNTRERFPVSPRNSEQKPHLKELNKH
jgi:hypothetical protein